MENKQDFRKIPPAVAGMMPISLPEMSVMTTPGGIRLNVYHRPDLPMLYLTAIVEGGNAEAMSPAVASLQTVVAREGTVGFSAEEIASTLEYAGATLKLSGLSHHRQFGLFALERSLDQVVPVFADIVCRPTFPERETRVRCETFASRFEVAFENVGFLANTESERQIMGPGHPLAIVDTPADIRDVTPERLRRFTDCFVSPGGITLYLCGNVNERVVRLVSEAFDSRLSLRPTHDLVIKPFEPLAPGDRRIIEKPDASQSAIFLTLPTIGRDHPDYLPLHLTVYALGGYFGSRLMRNIREEKGLTYGIHAGLHGYREGAYLNISAEADNRYVERVVDEVGMELRRLVDDPCRGEELQRIRQSALSTHAGVLDSPVTVTDAHIEAQTLGLPDGYFNAKQRAIESLTPELISEIARRYLDPELLRVSIAGAPQKGA